MKRIMIIGVGWEQLPLVYKAKEKGLYVIVTTIWDGPIPADQIYHVDSCELSQLEQIFLKEQPNGVIADECDYSMYAVAYLTEKYGLPGPSLSALTITNNKALQREIAEQISIPQPQYQMCWSIRQAERFALENGYPIMIKPVDNRGSIGVSKVANPEEMRKQWMEALLSTRSKMCIAEQYKEGNVVTVDGYCDNNNFYVLSAATKDAYCDTESVAKVLYYPGALSHQQMVRLKKYCTMLVEAMGIDFGFIHAEFIVNDRDDSIWFLEIANRGGGVYISDIILPYICRTNFIGHMLDRALGDVYSISLNHSQDKVLMYFLNCTGCGNPEHICKSTSNVLAMHLNAQKNSKHRQTKDARDRQGVVLLQGKNFEKLLQQAQFIEQHICAKDGEYTYVGQSR